MKNIYKFIFSLTVIFFVIAISVVNTSHYSFEHGIDPVELLRGAVERSKENINIFFTGRDVYINNEIKKQYQSKNLYKKNVKTKKIETALLPITSSTLDLLDFVSFPDQGGGLVKVKNKLLVLDRLGGFYSVNHSSVQELSFPKLPNSIGEYILSQKIPLGSNIMRVVSAVYDESNNHLYVGYTKNINKNLNSFAIAYLDVDENLISRGDWVEVYKSQSISSSEPSHGGGGKLYLMKDKIYFSLGYPDYIGYPEENRKKITPNSQNESSSFGKIFEFDVQKKQATVLSIGHRNPQGLTFLSDSSLVSVEHGPQGGDEINIIKKGNNYGWPYQSYEGIYGRYSNHFNENLKSKSPVKYTDPVFAFVPSVGVSSINHLKYFHAKWNGDLLVGSLKARTLFRIHLSSSNSVIYSEPIWIGHRIRDIIEFDKDIVLLTDDSKLLYLTLDRESLEADKKNNGLHLDAVLGKCLVCHGFQETTATSTAPSLLNINNRKIGGDSYENYSEAMKSKQGVWNEESLKYFIKNPQNFIPGTAMPSLNLTDKEVNKVVKALID